MTLAALGDSITNGGGSMALGVYPRSWAHWLALAMDLPYHGLASDGANARTVLREQVPRLRDGYEVGALFVGVNDVRALDWEREGFERGHDAALGFLAERCDRVLTATVPLDLGRPRAGAKVHDVNAAIEASARRNGALVLDLRDFGARNLLMADHVHPTAFGQIAIAERALDLLSAHGLEPRTRPSSLISYETSRRGRLRGDVTYAYRHAKVSARAAALSASASARRRRRRAA